LIVLRLAIKIFKAWPLPVHAANPSGKGRRVEEILVHREWHTNMVTVIPKDILESKILLQIPAGRHSKTCLRRAPSMPDRAARAKPRKWS